MAQVELKVEQLWEEEEKSEGVQMKEADDRGVQCCEDVASVSHIKEEQETVGLEQEPHEVCPFANIPMKRRDAESDQAGASSDKHPEGDNSSDNTDDSEFWPPFAEKLTTQRSKVTSQSADEICTSDSEWSWDFDCHTKTPVRIVRQMKDLPNGTFSAEDPQNKEHKCSECGKRFPHSTRLRKHQLTHRRRCPVCAKDFTETRRLTEHIRSHTGEKPFKCTVCSKGFPAKGYLKQHMRTHTGEKPYKCSICHKEFTFNAALRQHMRTHTGEKPFKCLNCSKEVRSLGDLKRHEQTHTREKPFSCSVCQKRFKVQRGLKRHESTHNHRCSTCGKNMATEKKLRLHMRTHAEDRPFGSSFCSKSFSQSSNLRTHLRTHTGEWPFRCSARSHDFTQRKPLKRHWNVHTGNQTFEDGSSDLCCKTEERAQVEMKAEPTEYSLIHVSVKTEEEESNISSLHQKVNEEIGERPTQTESKEKEEKSEAAGAYRGSNSDGSSDRQTKFPGRTRGHFKCRFCEKLFSHKCNLNQHIKTHTRENLNVQSVKSASS